MPAKNKSEIRSSKAAPRTETKRSQIDPKPKKIQNAESQLKLFGILCSFEHSNLFRISDFEFRISCFEILFLAHLRESQNLRPAAIALPIYFLTNFLTVMPAVSAQ
jgi:hypothetical protein